MSYPRSVDAAPPATVVSPRHHLLARMFAQFSVGVEAGGGLRASVGVGVDADPHINPQGSLSAQVTAYDCGRAPAATDLNGLSPGGGHIGGP